MRIPNSQVQNRSGESRYERQRSAFPPSRRQSTAIAVLGAESSQAGTHMLMAASAAAGIGQLACDFPGRAGPTAHWFHRPWPHVVKNLCSEAECSFLDPDFPAADLHVEDVENAWIVQWAADLAAATISLSDLATQRIEVPTLVVICTAAGVLIGRFLSPAAALSEVSRAASACSLHVPEPGPSELSVLAAGLALNEIMLGPRAHDSPASPLVGFYCLGQPRRTMTSPDASFADLAAQIIRSPARTPASFRGRRFIMIGAGAIGTWVGLIAAMEQQVQLDIHDGDVVEIHNLNRQVLFANTESGLHKAPTLANELGLLDPQGRYVGRTKYVATPSDIEDVTGSEALICVPDNDATRLICADIARKNHLLFATGGSSPTGGQIVLSHPQGPCFRCITGHRDADGSTPGNGPSCSRSPNDAVVSSNMVVAGLIISELRKALAPDTTANIRFQGDSPAGNRLSRMVTQANCPHRAQPTSPSGGA